MNDFEKEYNLKFSLFGKNYQTKIIASSKIDATQKLNDFILSKTKICEIEITNSDFNIAVNLIESISDLITK